MSDNSWNEKGGFPPIGTECEYFWDENPVRWLKVLITDSGLDCGRDCVALRQGDEIRISINWRHFRPIKTDRDRAIEDILDIYYNGDDISQIDSVKDLATALYDAGYRKTHTPD